MTLWTWLWVLEHETVHLLLGLACFKTPKRWRVSSDGGHIGFDRGGNWLITIAPYVFPLIPLLTYSGIQLLSAFVPLNAWVLPASMGFAMAAHIAFTWLESDYRQPDIQRVGGLFTLSVAPTLHSLCVAAILILTTSSSNPDASPLPERVREIGQNGFAAWKLLGDGGRRLLFAQPNHEPKGGPPSETYRDEASSPNPISSSKGIRFERKSSARPKTNFKGSDR